MPQNLLCALVALLLCGPAPSCPAEDVSDEVRYAVRLYGRGMYERSREILASLPEQNALTEGYAILCSEKLKKEGCGTLLADYDRRYGRTSLTSDLHLEYGRLLFDSGDYDEALVTFSKVSEKSVSYRDYTEVLFKTAYSKFALGDHDDATLLFGKVTARREGIFTMPSKYALGYIMYSRNDFAGAFAMFEEVAADEEFASQARYYMLECRFMEKDYSYVISNASRVFSEAPAERRSHLARIISEAYLVSGDPAKADEYYSAASASEQLLTRSDYFYAGTLKYEMKDYAGALENFARMEHFDDSTGQAASYKMAYCHIRGKDKVSAMNCFRLASSMDYDAGIKEDASFNHAKLAFDLNHDALPFVNYLQAYPSSGRDDMIYDYIAIAYLYSKDYDSAVGYYDRIDNLAPRMKSNYVKANYLLSERLASKGAWAEAVAPLKAAVAYLPKNTSLGKLARYNLAEAYYHNDQYAEAVGGYTELYNNSALDLRDEGRLLTYNIAYSYFMMSDYASASTWFDKYIRSGDAKVIKDAMTRRADCSFLAKDYRAAASLYEQVISAYPSSDDLYPVYCLGLSYGFVDDNKSKVEALRPALASSSDARMYAESIYELGRAYVSLGRENDAAQTFEILASGNENRNYAAKSLIELGMLERNSARYERALECYKKVVDNYEGTEAYDDALLAIESIYQSQGKLKDYFTYTESIGKEKRSEQQKEEMIFASAEEIFLTEDYDKAIVALNNYLADYPGASQAPKALYYLAESYKATGQKEKASSTYARVVDLRPEGSYAELSILNFARLSYELGRYDDAYSSYCSLASFAQIPQNLNEAAVGRIRSAYAGRNYERAVSDAALIDAGALSENDLRTVRSLEAHSLLRLSRRDEAYAIFSSLASDPSTKEGAEAAYLVIQDIYDSGRFAEVESKVYDFADKAGDQSYFLAKAFIVLGDSFVENDNIKQAGVTFESIRDGYVPYGEDDDVPGIVSDRLAKLNNLNR